MPLAVAFIDWVIVAGYGVFVVLVGVISKKKQEDADDYLLGGRRLPWWAIGVSLIATSFSSLSLLGWTGLAYTSRFQWFQLQLGDLLGITIVCLVFLPFFAGRGITTAYEFLEQRLGRGSRWTASLIFHVIVLARAGLLLFATALAGAELLGIVDQLGWVILAVGLAAIAYSAVGGLGAVVWTDTVQLLLVVVGVGACLVIAVGELPGGVADVFAQFGEGTGSAFVDTSMDMEGFPTLFSSIFAYGVLALSVFGTNQQTVQRYLACEDLRASRRAAFLGWGIGAFVVFLTMALGIAFAAVYDNAKQPDDIPVLATFMRDYAPVGVTGILIAAILAASMSSMDSAIHSMATATLVDFVEPLKKQPFASDTDRLRTARVLTVVHGGLAIGAAFLASGQGKNVIDVLVGWMTFLSGPILGLFLLAMFERTVGQRAALIGLAAGYLAAILGNDVFGVFAESPFQQAGIHKIWTAPWTLAVTYAVAGIAAVLGRSSLREPSM